MISQKISFMMPTVTSYIILDNETPVNRSINNSIPEVTESLLNSSIGDRKNEIEQVIEGQFKTINNQDLGKLPSYENNFKQITAAEEKFSSSNDAINKESLSEPKPKPQFDKFAINEVITIDTTNLTDVIPPISKKNNGFEDEIINSVTPYKLRIKYDIFGSDKKKDDEDNKEEPEKDGKSEKSRSASVNQSSDKKSKADSSKGNDKNSMLVSTAADKTKQKKTESQDQTSVDSRSVVKKSAENINDDV